MMSRLDREVGRSNNVHFRTEAGDFTFSNGVLKDQKTTLDPSIASYPLLQVDLCEDYCSAFNVMLCL